MKYFLHFVLFLIIIVFVLLVHHSSILGARLLVSGVILLLVEIRLTMKIFVMMRFVRLLLNFRKLLRFFISITLGHHHRIPYPRSLLHRFFCLLSFCFSFFLFIRPGQFQHWESKKEHQF